MAKETGNAPHPEIMIPLIATRKELEITRAQVDERRGGGVRRDRHDDRIQRRHDDRAAARGDAGGQDRRDRGLLQLRHQRPDADRVRPVARRCRQRSCRIMSSWGFCRRTRSFRSTSRASARWCASPSEKGRATKNHLKLGICGEHGGDPASIAFCETGRAGLRVVQPVPRAGGAAGGGAGGAGRGGRPDGVISTLSRGTRGKTSPA